MVQKRAATKRQTPTSNDTAKQKKVTQSQDASTRKNKKEVLKERKAKRQKNFHVIQEATGLWEVLRQGSTPKDKKRELVPQIIKICGDRVAELASSHTASRIIQSCVKYGNADDQAAIQKQLMPKIVELSKSPYARFVVSKLIAQASKDSLTDFVKAFKGRAPELLRHPAGTHVLDDLYCAANLEQRRMMAAEFYGKEYALFENGTLNNTKGAPDTLAGLLSAVDGQKQLSIIKHFASSITPVIEKGLVDNQLAHKLIMEYLKSAPVSLVEDAVEALSGDHLLHMIHTHEGAEAACMVIAYGSAKDRKKSIRAFKGHVEAALRDEWGYLPVATALSVTDDTSLLKKIIISEIEKKLGDFVTDKHAHKVLLQILRPYSSRYFPPALMDILRPAEKVNIDTKGDEEVNESKRLGVSKKDDITRRKEILEGGLGSALHKACMESTEEYLTSQFSCDILVEMCVGGQDTILIEIIGESAIDELHNVVVEAASSHLTDYYASRSLRRIILTSSAQDGKIASKFSHLLWKKILKGKSKELKETHAAKVVAALLHSGCEEPAKSIKKELKGSVDNVDEWAQQFVKQKQK